MLRYQHRQYAPPLVAAPALAVQNLLVAHPGATATALAGLTLDVAVGERVALVGPNGAGKSTLLKVIAGLLPTQAGSVRIYGLPVGACHHRVAYLPQRGEIDWRFPLTVERLVLAGRYVHLGWLRPPGRQDRMLAGAMLERLGIANLGKHQIGELSGGQQQRALLARALAQDADLLLLDEPFNAVDAATRTVIFDVLDDLQHQGKTVLIATHDLERLHEAFDRVVALRDGRLAADAPAALYEGTARYV